VAGVAVTVARMGGVIRAGGVVGVATAVVGMGGVIAMGRMRIVARVVGVTAIGSVGFVIRVVATACMFGLGVVVHVGGVRVRLGRSAVVLVAGVVAVRLVVVLVVRLGIGPGVAVGSVSGVVHVFPIDDESGIRIMVEAPAGGTRFAAIGARHRSPIQLYPRGVCMKPLYTPGGYRRQGVAMRTTPAGPRHERRGPAGARQITGGP
jgi:hypothetical protein